MARFTTALVAAAAMSSASAFSAPQVHSISSNSFATTATSSSSTTRLFAGKDDQPIPTIERGVSVDQDGKSNVWAIEPKMEVDTKSTQEKTSGLLIGGAAFAAFAVGAGIVLSNLPDPNQF